ncbi:MAG: ribosome small subunit-dependent GTPase A [Rhodothermales bacterium]|nr:ribosome small subunit-dependent GTPase A [Rhodothermales bacterium]MBO6779851.1 ribosome small subunit-dependent GTPase A [Rhodothermales bacterium]
MDDETVPCKVRGKFRLSAGGETSPVVVGDRVVLRRNADDTGLIVGIGERSRSLVRRAAGRRIGKAHVIATNIDFAWVVQAWDLPKFNPGFVDRFLVMAATNSLPAGIVINKVDLVDGRIDKQALKAWTRVYEELGYPVLAVSAQTGKGLRKLRKALRDKISVVAGPSGVGKTTLLNTISPGLDLRTGEISAATGKGTHTTTVASLHPLEQGGFVVDTPGLREYGLIGLDPPHLSHYFPEMVPLIPHCRFPNCTHDHEPGCAVKEAVDEGRLNIERYDSYLGMLYSLHLGDADVGR